jgi:hypothetical protein
MARGTIAKTPAKPASPPKPGARKPRRQNTGSAVVTLTVIVVVVLAMTALPLCILVVAGTLPTVVAALVDRHQRRYLARTVGAMNLAGVLPGALHMWESGITFASLQQVIDSPYNWLVMYGAAAVGWVLYFCVPPVVAMVVEIKVDESKRRLEARAKALIEEWGEEVTGRKREG